MNKKKKKQNLKRKRTGLYWGKGGRGSLQKKGKGPTPNLRCGR